MKDKIVLFIIGLLLGAVISTGAIYAYSTISNDCDCNNTQNMQMNGGTPPDMNNSNNNNQNSDNGQPPAKPDESNTQSSTQENS